MILSFSYSSTVNAALSATTAKTIQGTEPRLSSVLETEIANQAFSRLGFTYNNMDYYDSNISTLSISPSAYSPSTFVSAISPKIKSLSVGDALDDDGDNNFMLSANTALTLKIYNGANVDITANTSSFCDLASTSPGPYKLVINGDLSLATQYGDPIKKDYTITTNGIFKQPSKQYPVTLGTGVCLVQPNPDNNNAGHATWDSIKQGFKVQANSSDNFPTTGFNGAMFNLKVAGVNVTTLDFTSYPKTQNSVKISITTPSIDTINVVLNGPSYDTAKGGSGPVAFTAPGEIEIKDSSSMISYKFNITKWFIPGDGASPAQATNYCSMLAGGGKYRVPTRAEYTNNPQIFFGTCSGNGLDTGGASCLGGNYTRAIGEGVSSEWGWVDGYYSSSDWNFPGYYWTSEMYSSSEQYAVVPRSGHLGSRPISEWMMRYAACVSL